MLVLKLDLLLKKLVMKFSNLLRLLTTFLSFPSNLRREKLSEKQKKLINNLQIKTVELIKTDQQFQKMNTHKIFSNSVLSLIQSGQLENFLRLGFIQKMFFVHNRLYNYKFLKKILSEKSNFWIKLLKEDNIGNPIPYFLYKSSSGNRIRQVYLLKQGFEYARINNVDAVIEIGGGFGSMASILHKINKNIDYIIYDLPEVNLLQFYYLKSQDINCEISAINKNINLLSQIDLLRKKLNLLKEKKKKILIIAHWSLSEMPIKLRNDLEFLFVNCDYAFISFQDYFEDISNILYFEELKKKINNNFSSSLAPINDMNSIFNSNKHFSFLIKKC